MPAILCSGLSRTYGDIQALKPLDLEVETGSVFGFLGRNGAGKTTTIRLLTGLARPTTGEAWIDGVPTTDGNFEARKLFGYLPEEPAFYGWMTPGEFLDYAGRLFGLDRGQRESRIAELLHLVGLEEDVKRRIGGFSRGMRQRLGLAQALIHRPPVLFLDEPTSAMDPAGRKDVLELIGRLRGKTTIFLSSHILSDVERVCDTIGVIHKGQLLLVSDRDELLSKYASDAVVLSFESRQTSSLMALVSKLEQQAWLTRVSLEQDDLRLAVNDVDRAKRELLPLIIDSRLILTRYEWVSPTLEDVFLSISA